MIAVHATPCADRASAEAYSVAELRAMVFDGAPGLAPHAALLALASRAYRARTADMSRALGSDDPRLRALAVHGLASEATPDALAALRGALASTDAAVARGAARGLARVADREALPDLDRAAGGPGALARAAARAALVVRFRHALDGGSLPPAGRLLPPEEGASTSIRPATASRAAAEEAIAQLHAGVAGLRVAPDHAVRVTVGDCRLMVLRAADGVAGDLAARMGARRAVLAVVAQWLGLEDDGWQAEGLLVSEPGGAGRVRVALVTPDGRLTMDGAATLEGGRARLTLTRVEAPGAVPTRAEATFESGRLTIDRLEVGTERHRPRVPVRLRPEPHGPAAVKRR